MSDERNLCRIALGNHLPRQCGIATFTTDLEWLTTIQRTVEGYFAPVGTNGFFERGMAAAVFDQQPVEACATVSACMHAFRTTGDHRWAEHARRGRHGKDSFPPVESP